MATIPEAILLCASSPYARKGRLWEHYHRYFGKAGPILVWNAPTRTMNPTVPQAFIDAELEKDPVWAAAEYLAEFRTDIEAYVSREAVEAVHRLGHARARAATRRSLCRLVDPSGGSSDSFSLCIAHKEGEVGVQDVLREVRPPFSPEGVVREFADLCKNYRITSVRGDRYAGIWPTEEFRQVRHQVRGERASEGSAVSELPAASEQRQGTPTRQQADDQSTRRA